jgi:hypothetical protein
MGNLKPKKPLGVGDLVTLVVQRPLRQLTVAGEPYIGKLREVAEELVENRCGQAIA